MSAQAALENECAKLQALTRKLASGLDRIQANAALRKQRGCVTEHDRLAAQRVYEDAFAAHRKELISFYGMDSHDARLSTKLCTGAEGSLLRELWDAREAAAKRFNEVDMDYCRGPKDKRTLAAWAKHYSKQTGHSND